MFLFWGTFLFLSDFEQVFDFVTSSPDYLTFFVFVALVFIQRSVRFPATAAFLRFLFVAFVLSGRCWR